jgi:hypothetical protein
VLKLGIDKGFPLGLLYQKLGDTNNVFGEIENGGKIFWQAIGQYGRLS